VAGAQHPDRDGAKINVVVFRRGTERGRKVTLLVAACLAAVAVAVVVAWQSRPSDDASKATVNDAVRSFRAEGESGGRHRAEADETAPGVYRYATSGSESVTGAEFGTTHKYGGVSTITVSSGRCGERERWQVLVERWTQAEACAGQHGGGIVRLTQFHEFFGEEQEDSLLCHGPAGAEISRPGARYSSSCRSRGSSISTVTHVIGPRRISVGGQGFDAIGTVSESTLRGGTSGTSSREDWRRRSDGLLLSRWSQTDVDTSEGGGSHYTERYTIRLLSTKPRR
jgi:hypothetical protein